MVAMGPPLVWTLQVVAVETNHPATRPCGAVDRRQRPSHWLGIASLSTVKAITPKRATMPLRICPAGGLAPMSDAVAITAKSGLAVLPRFMRPLPPKRGMKSGILWMISALT